MNLNDSISVVLGVGPQRVKVLNGLGVENIKDMLYYFPRQYLDRTTLTPIKHLKKGDQVTLIAQVETLGQRRIRRGTMFQIIASDGTGLLTLNWFNGVRYVKNLFKVGDKLAISGKVEWYNGFSITHPEIEKLRDDEDPLKTGKVVPIYPLTQELRSVGLDQRGIRKILGMIVSELNSISEIMPKAILKEHDLIFLDKALRDIHFSKNLSELRSATKRLKFDEHFFLQMLLAKRKQQIKENKCEPIEFKTRSYNKIIDNLNFELTGSQKLTMREIVDDFLSQNPMNRMIQGDVGCGKTIVSILSAAIVVDNDYQVAIMAPTDLLAKQLYKNFKTHFKKIKIQCSLLTGSIKSHERKNVLADIKSGNTKIIIGTHALFQKDVQYKNLGFTVIDEQHRFGVNQRQKLLSKSVNPNLMAMTATPIPRTLAITYNGDMDISIIDELPKNRPEIHTSFIEKDNLSTAYNFIRDQIKEGGQTIIVYPLISESEKHDLSAAEESYHYLKKTIFPDQNIGLVHGKLDDEDKNNVMSRFMKGDINILVSTTVVEVGIDNPTANVILINNCERFGLSQMHQLRGRVGRGVLKSYCLLHSDSESPNTKDRLGILVKSRNGFEIADEDLKLRGPGEFFGEKQSGFIRFKIADLIEDGPIIRIARTKAFEIINKDANLSLEKNILIKEKFDDEYLDLFLKTTVN